MTTTPQQITCQQFSRDNLLPLLGVANGDPQDRIANYLFRYLSELGAKSVVVEERYIDGDYLDDFSTYYARCFADYDRRCTRLHFYDIDLSADQLREAILGKASTDLQPNYLGFVVVRPIPQAAVGRTVLRVYPDDNGRRHYPATRVYESNLYGLVQRVESLAYQQQDRTVAACATVALWCAFQKTSELFGSRLPRRAEITSQATRTGGAGRAFPSDGLEIRQVCEAIRGVGLEPEVFQVSGATYASSLLYGYLASGTPAILCVEIENVGLHAFTVCGYSLRDDSCARSEVSEPDPMPVIGRRIDEFYVHDDQVGPFARLKVRPPAGANTAPYHFDGTWHLNGTALRLNPIAIVVPVYHKIRLTFIEVQQALLGLDKLVRAVIPGDLSAEWEIRLTTVNAHKGRVRTNPRLTEQKREAVLLSSHPRFIWKANLRLGGQTRLQILADATEIRGAFPFYAATWYDDSDKVALTNTLSRIAPGTLRQYISEELLDLLRT